MTWRLVIELDDVERDEAVSFARGVAQRSGQEVELFRDDHGESVFVAALNPQRGQA